MTTTIYQIKSGKGVPLAWCIEPGAAEAYCKNKWAQDEGQHELADGILGDAEATLHEMEKGDFVVVDSATECFFSDDPDAPPHPVFVIECVEAFTDFDDVEAETGERGNLL